MNELERKIVNHIYVYVFVSFYFSCFVSLGFNFFFFLNRLTHTTPNHTTLIRHIRCVYLRAIDLKISFNGKKKSKLK